MIVIALHCFRLLFQIFATVQKYAEKALKHNLDNHDEHSITLQHLDSNQKAKIAIHLNCMVIVMR